MVLLGDSYMVHILDYQEQSSALCFQHSERGVYCLELLELMLLQYIGRIGLSCRDKHLAGVIVTNFRDVSSEGSLPLVLSSSTNFINRVCLSTRPVKNSDSAMVRRLLQMSSFYNDNHIIAFAFIYLFFFFT